MAKAAKASTPTLYMVPPGSTPGRCRGATCTATIYWVRNRATGRMLPVDCDVPDGKRPSEATEAGEPDLFGEIQEVHEGFGVSHFTTCPDADEFSGGRRDRGEWKR